MIKKCSKCRCHIKENVLGHSHVEVKDKDGNVTKHICQTCALYGVSKKALPPIKGFAYGKH